jgi:glycosyltransferase involved in cell wall biosynthesis
MASEYPIRRHCMVVHAYYPLGETRVEREALALRDRGVEVDVVCLRKPGEPREDVIDGVTVYRVPISRRKGSGILVQSLEYLEFFVLAFGRVTSLHLRRRYAVVQVHNLPDLLVFTALVPRLMGARVILDLHDLMPEFYMERFGRGMNSPQVRLVRAQEWISCKFADHIITVTDPWRQALIERGQPGQKIAVVMNVADERAFNPSVVPDQALKRRKGFRLFYHGNLDHRYGLDLVVQAMDRIRRELPDVHLTVHGGGEYRKVIEAMIEGAKLQDHVDINRVVSAPVLAKRIKAADLGIVPYRDGVFTGALLPTKLMEYAALGLPAIAARTPMISRYFNDSMVEFFAPGDVEGLVKGIVRLYHDRERLGELARNISAFTRQWPWRKQSAEYVDLVDRLTVAARRNPRRGMVSRG